MVHRTRLPAWLPGFLACICPLLAFAGERPLLHPLFSDHAVLQRGSEVPLWGWADPGTTVRVRFADQTRSATAADDGGKWTCSLDPLEASSEGRTLSVETLPPGRRVVARNLLVGDVWLCSGQSNMEMGITLCREEEEIARADDPGLRLLTIPQRIAYTPQQTFTADWKPCSPAVLREGGWGGFSATAYFFGKKLRQELEVPVGLIHASWGGTVIEAWASGPALRRFPTLRPQLRKVHDIATSASATPLIDATDAWFREHDPGTRSGWNQGTADTSSWRKATLPNTWPQAGIPGGHEGVAWVQREFRLPADWADRPLALDLGQISDTDTTWLNGREVGRTNSYSVPTCYAIPAGVAREGRNVITMRITNAGGGGFQPDGPPMRVSPAANASGPGEEAAVKLSGEWRLRETSRLAETGRPLVGNPNVPCVLYNGMIAPLTPAALTGAIWYQGEANTSRARQYRKLLPTMIHDWRLRFGRRDLAFHIVSLANFEDATASSGGNGWAELREAQAMTARTVPHCGLAVAIDIGDANDIHPKNKREVGRRLALNALAETYGKPVIGSGPWYDESTREGNRIRIRFDHTHGGLRFKGPADKSFAIAGKDRKFVWAEPQIDGDTIIVSAPSIARPVAVRYAWDDNPRASLYNGAGLPAVPFRTDDW